MSVSACSKDCADSRMARSVGGGFTLYNGSSQPNFLKHTHTHKLREYHCVSNTLSRMSQEIYTVSYKIIASILSFSPVETFSDTHTYRVVLWSFREPASLTEQPDNTSVNQCQVPGLAVSPEAFLRTDS